MRGLCECGCGEPTGIAKANNAARGWVKGKPRRFRRGHQSRGVVRAKEDPAKRFWEKVVKHPGGCWEWQAVTHRGYGLFRLKHGAPMLRAHRVSYEWAYGPVPLGMYVLHACDNKRCVNPAHLRAGTQRMNMQDARERGLLLRGEAKASAKLTESDVAEIRMRAQRGESMNSLSRAFGVSGPTIQSIVHRRKWRHVA